MRGLAAGVVVAMTAMLSSLFAPAALAQSYPARPIRFRVGGPPGSGADQVARMMATRLSERLC